MNKTKILSFFLLLILSGPIFAQSEAEILKKANDLIEDKKYESAFRVLDTFDKDNVKPEIVLLKEDILLSYFVTSMMHQLFALKDLKKTEDISDYRGKEGSFDMHMFEADSILLVLIKKYPENYKLYKGLGDFYYAAQTHYSGNWLKNDSTLFELIIRNYRIAAEHGLGDHSMYFALGLSNLSLSNYKKAIPDLLKAIELKKDYVDAEYNLAYAYLFTDDRENAIKYAKISIDHYTDPELKSDAARMVAQAYLELKDDKNAIKYYELARSLSPANYENIRPLLDLYVKTGNSKKDVIRDAFFELAPEKPTIYNDLSQIYLQYEKTSELLAFFKKQLSHYAGDKKVSGNLYFYLGRLYLDVDKKQSKEYFLKAKDIFATVYEKDNAVFDSIQEGIQQAEEK